MRPADMPCFIDGSSRAERDIGGRPRFEFNEILKDILAIARISVSKRG